MENEYDIVYHYGIGKSPDFNQTPPQWFIDNVNGDERKAYTTITHFWDADYGPDKLSDLNGTACWELFNFYWSYSIENALQKMMKYVNGNFDCRWIYGIKEQLCNYIAFGNDFHWLPLIDLYKLNGTIYAIKYNYGEWYSAGGCPVYDLRSYPQMAKGMAYEILGRMCHLLQDMSVPAHVHSDAHACKNCMYCDVYEEVELSLHRWTANEIWNNTPRNEWNNNYGPFIDPYHPDVNDPIYFLMYFMNQITDHYASGRTNGDDNFYQNFPYLSEIIPTLGPPILQQLVVCLNRKLLKIHSNTFTLLKKIRLYYKF